MNEIWIMFWNKTLVQLIVMPFKYWIQKKIVYIYIYIHSYSECNKMNEKDNLINNK